MRRSFPGACVLLFACLASMAGGEGWIGALRESDERHLGFCEIEFTQTFGEPDPSSPLRSVNTYAGLSQTDASDFVLVRDLVNASVAPRSDPSEETRWDELADENAGVTSRWVTIGRGELNTTVSYLGTKSGFLGGEDDLIRVDGKPLHVEKRRTMKLFPPGSGSGSTYNDAAALKWALGRGFAAFLDTIDSEVQVDGITRLSASGRCFDSLTGRWELEVDPALDNLVRSARFTPELGGSQALELSNAGVAQGVWPSRATIACPGAPVPSTEIVFVEIRETHSEGVLEKVLAETQVRHDEYTTSVEDVRGSEPLSKVYPPARAEE